MKIFLSWSGTRSKFVADVLRGWLPLVIQSVKPWMSDTDISAGSRWLNNVSSELSEAKLGIICVTPENQNNPWLLFEAGALSKVIDHSHVCPLLLDLTPGQLAGPLSQFQANQITADGMLKIVSTLNRLLGPAQIPEADFEEIFTVWWPHLENKLKAAPNTETVTPKRTQEEILEEIVSNTREQIRRENLRIALQREDIGKFEQMVEVMRRQAAFMQNLPTLMANKYSKGTKLPPDELVNLVHGINPSDLQQFIDAAQSSVKSRRTFANDVLNAEKDDGIADGTPGTP